MSDNLSSDERTSERFRRKGTRAAFCVNPEIQRVFGSTYPENIGFFWEAAWSDRDCAKPCARDQRAEEALAASHVKIPETTTPLYLESPEEMRVLGRNGDPLTSDRPSVSNWIS